MFARSKQRHNFFKRRFSDSAVAANLCGAFKKAFWFMLVAQTALTLSGGRTLKWGLWAACYKLFNGPAWTHCIPGTWAVHMAHRGSEHASTMLGWAEPKDKAALVFSEVLLVRKRLQIHNKAKFR